MTSIVQIAVVYSVTTGRSKRKGYSAPDEDTKESAKEVWQALIESGATATLIPIDEGHIETLFDIRTDCIFNMIEWDGLDLRLALESLDILQRKGIPFTGATKENYLLANDKIFLKKALVAHSLPTARSLVFVRGDEPIDPSFPFPAIVKLSLEHCSVGLDRLAVVTTKETLREIVKKRVNEFRQPVLVEEFVEGREFQVTLLDTDTGLQMLPPAEIIFKEKKSGDFLTFASRWDEGHPDYAKSSVAPARLSREEVSRLQTIAVKTFTKLGYRDYARLDMRMRGSDFFILEANANPGLGDDDDYGMTVSYKAAGMNFSEFVWAIIRSAMRRSGSS